jgi:ParB-like chromosome segregation protein Spo0J
MKYPEAKLIPIDQIKPYAKNAKKHPQSQIDLLAKQIAEGFDQPIVVDKNMTIIKGHGRRLACLQMGLKEVPVIVRDDLTAQQVKAARIADNKLAETDWDMATLAEELEALDAGGLDLSYLGFNDDELESLLGEMAGEEMVEQENEGNTEEIDVEEYEFEHTCPKCGFEFND